MCIREGQPNDRMDIDETSQTCSLGTYYTFFTKKILEIPGGEKGTLNFPLQKKALKSVAQWLKHRSLKLKSVVQTWTWLIFFFSFPPSFSFLPYIFLPHLHSFLP